jgi:hypothetical protein
LAKVDADFALQEAQKLTGDAAYLALARIISRIAIDDWDRALQLYNNPPSDEAKQVFARSLPAAMIRNHLAAHPEATDRIFGSTSRTYYLGQAAEANYGMTGDLEGFERMFASLTDSAEQDHICLIMALRLNREGNRAKALELLRRIKSPDTFIDAAWQLLSANPR